MKAKRARRVQRGMTASVVFRLYAVDRKDARTYVEMYVSEYATQDEARAEARHLTETQQLEMRVYRVLTTETIDFVDASNTKQNIAQQQRSTTATKETTHGETTD